MIVKFLVKLWIYQNILILLSNTSSWLDLDVNDKHVSTSFPKGVEDLSQYPHCDKRIDT